MRRDKPKLMPAVLLGLALVFTGFTLSSGYPPSIAFAEDAPVPLLEKGHPVDWWFVFKFNSKSFPGCGTGHSPERQCLFGGDVQPYPAFSQQYVYASSERPSLQKGNGCAGGTTSDPLGATFDEVYNGSFHYVIWNDQFYNDPEINGCSGTSCGSPWGHSKGFLAWNDTGEGLMVQVTTPSWPAAGSTAFPRKTEGNTLGCISRDNDIEVSQHFFALKLTKDDLVTILGALENASVVTDPTNRQLVNNGGPADVQQLVEKLGSQSHSTTYTKFSLSSGVEVISKASRLHVAPWQLVSSALGGVSLRAATWWASPKIPTTTSATTIECWDKGLDAPGAVEIATSGQWQGKVFGLKGVASPDGNHAKIGVSLFASNHFAIFGDMNQQGAVSGGNCASSQNGRGGLFYVIDNKELFDSLTGLIRGDTAAEE